MDTVTVERVPYLILLSIIMDYTAVPQQKRKYMGPKEINVTGVPFQEAVFVAREIVLCDVQVDTAKELGLNECGADI